MISSKRAIQLASCLAGLGFGFAALNSCIFPVKCDDPRPIELGTHRVVAISVVANGGGEPRPEMAAAFRELEPLSLEISTTELILRYNSPNGPAAATFAVGF